MLVSIHGEALTSPPHYTTSRASHGLDIYIEHKVTNTLGHRGILSQARASHGQRCSKAVVLEHKVRHSVTHRLSQC